MNAKKEKKKWIRYGLGFGIMMNIVLNVFAPLIEDGNFNLRKFMIGLIAWSLGGLLWGYVMRNSINNPLWRKEDKN